MIGVIHKFMRINTCVVFYVDSLHRSVIVRWASTPLHLSCVPRRNERLHIPEVFLYAPFPDVLNKSKTSFVVMALRQLVHLVGRRGKVVDDHVRWAVFVCDKVSEWCGN